MHRDGRQLGVAPELGDRRDQRRGDVEQGVGPFLGPQRL